MYCTGSKIYPVAGEKDGLFCPGYWTLSGERFLSSIVSDGENIFWERLEIISRFLVVVNRLKFGFVWAGLGLWLHPVCPYHAYYSAAS